MNAPPLVTIAIPAYNHVPYVEECLRKVVEEPYPAKELVIIDDGSTDGTGEKIEKWIADHKPAFPVRLFKRENRGIPRTLNELIEHSRGKYFRLCPSDDYLMPGTLAGMVRVLEGRDDKSLVLGDAIVINQHGQKTHESVISGYYNGILNNYQTNLGLRTELVKRWSLAGPLHLIRLSMFDKLGRYDETLLTEDGDMMYRAVGNDQVIFYDDAKVAAYRVHGRNSADVLFKKNSDAHEAERWRVIEKNRALFTGALRRHLDYNLYVYREMYYRKQRQGATLSRWSKTRIRLTGKLLSWLGRVD